jgi:predicted HD phosphohydrolase
LYQEHGHKNYDSHITHLENALQTTELAKNNGESEEFQLSCFLHDIGHLLLDENNSNNDFLKEDLKHETIGFKYLCKNFNEEITYPIMYHVLAKRYLCTVDNNYYESLSNASKKSFEIQGGKIDNHFLKILEKNDKFKNAIKLRKYEDISKSHNNTNFTINIDYIKNLIHKFIL